jgi:hypothetical protein
MNRLLVALGVAALLAACAHPFNALQIAPGTPRDQVIARAGQPTAVVPIAGGERLQYSMQPFGQYAVMVDLDTAGRVTRARQVLTEREFHRIAEGTWTRDDLLREFGPPARIDGVTSWRGPVWSYRWNDGSDMFWFVYLDPQGVVRRSHPGMEFVNAPDRD